MKKVMYLLSIMLMVTLVGCGASATSAPTKEASKQAPVDVTAEEICNALKSGGLPMSNIVVYTEETDTNKLLGRPGQYTGKVNFADTRIKDSTDNGTVEVFANLNDAKTRKDYIESVTKGSPMLLQYMYLKNNVLLRVDKDLNPSQAKEYETALGKIVK